MAVSVFWVADFQCQGYTSVEINICVKCSHQEGETKVAPAASRFANWTELGVYNAMLTYSETTLFQVRPVVPLSDSDDDDNQDNMVRKFSF